MNTKYAIFTIRYSLFLPSKADAWRIGRKSEDAYLASLFDPERLRFRRSTFSRITLPSILAAIDACPEVQTSVHVVTSTLLPREDKEFLEGLAAQHPVLSIVLVDPENSSFTAETERHCAELPDGSVVASIRIDDDDAVTSTYLQQLSGYITQDMTGRVVSLCSGYCALGLEDGRVVGPFPYKWRFGSVGLALIRNGGHAAKPATVYGVGNHMLTDERTATILDARQPAILRLYHQDNDSHATGNFVPKELSSEARKQFGIAPDTWADADNLPPPVARATKPRDDTAAKEREAPRKKYEDLQAEHDALRKEQRVLNKEISARRSRLAWWIDYLDYRMHRGLGSIDLLGPKLKMRFEKSAAKRHRASYDRGKVRK